MPHSGHCLCKSTTVHVGGESQKSQIACHCTDCRHTSGAAFSTNILAPIKDVEITGSVAEYDSPSASGNPVTRVFCSKCGSSLAHKSKAFGDKMAVQTGNLDGFESLPFEAELFTKDRYQGLAQIQGADQANTMPDA